jgi:hypothetical protein
MVRLGRLIPLAAMVAASVAIANPAPSTAQQSASWLDTSPIQNWNTVGMPIPQAMPATVSGQPATPADWPPNCIHELRHPETPEDIQLHNRGWYLAQPYQAGYGIKLIPAQAGFDGMCRPWGYNYFVFVDGQFAGTIAPQAMNARTDGAAQSVNFFGGSTARIFAEFARYTPSDALCCPSSTSSVQYTIQVSPPLVIPNSVNTSPNPTN